MFTLLVAAFAIFLSNVCSVSFHSLGDTRIILLALEFVAFDKSQYRWRSRCNGHVVYVLPLLGLTHCMRAAVHSAHCSRRCSGLTFASLALAHGRGQDDDLPAPLPFCLAERLFGSLPLCIFLYLPDMSISSFVFLCLFWLKSLLSISRTKMFCV